jgi:hypothetical protein
MRGCVKAVEGLYHSVCDAVLLNIPLFGDLVKVSFIAAPSTAALPYRKPSSAGTSRDICGARESNKTDELCHWGLRGRYIDYVTSWEIPFESGKGQELVLQNVKNPQSPSHCVPRVRPSGLKRPDSKSDHSSAYPAEDKNNWSYISASLTCLNSMDGDICIVMLTRSRVVNARD